MGRWAKPSWPARGQWPYETTSGATSLVLQRLHLEEEVIEMTTRIAPEGLVELDRPFAEFFRTLSGPWPFRPLFALTPGKHFLPTADVFARNGDMVVKLDLPGVEPKDIHVKLEEGELIVTGERKADQEIKEEGYYRKESSYGLFERHMS